MMENFEKRAEVDSANELGFDSREPVTDEELQQQLEVQKQPQSKSGTMARVLFFMVIVLLALYFLKNGSDLKSTGNQNKVEVSKPAETYRLQ